MMNKLSTSELEFIISRLIQNANDAVDEDDNTDYSAGKKMAYYEMLDTIKNELLVRDVDLKSIGLDINLENFI